MALSGPRAWNSKATVHMHTIDRQRYTSELLTEYVLNFHPNMVKLRGNVALINVITVAYQMHFLKVVPEG